MVNGQSIRSEEPPGVLLFLFQERSTCPHIQLSWSKAEEEDLDRRRRSQRNPGTFCSLRSGPASVVAAASEVTTEKRWRSSYLGRLRKGGTSEAGEEEEGGGGLRGQDTPGRLAFWRRGGKSGRNEEKMQTWPENIEKLETNIKN